MVKVRKYAEKCGKAQQAMHPMLHPKLGDWVVVTTADKADMKESPDWEPGAR